MPHRFIVRHFNGQETGVPNRETADELARQLARMQESGTHIELYEYVGCYVVPQDPPPVFQIDNVDNS